jgi:high-affinity Fe2+/Pb2+ permease
MSAADTATTRRRRPGVRVATAQWLADFHPAGVMHGAVVMGAALALVDEDAVSSTGVVAASAGVLVVYWLTHSYTDALGLGLEGEREHLVRRLLRSGRRDTAILLGGIPALVVFSVALSFDASYTDAVETALWVTLVVLAGCGYLAAHLAGVTRWRLVAETAFAGLVGACIVVLNTWLH